MLIIDMPMPKYCANCPCCICLNGMKPAYCKAVMVDDDNIVDGLMWRETDPNNRPSWCPIVGVLPEEHGDLIDMDALMIELMDRGIEGVQTDDLAEFQQIVMDAKAVIAAER